MGINDTDQAEIAQTVSGARSTRRTVLLGAGVVSAAAAATALAACGSSKADTSSNTPAATNTAPKDLGKSSDIPVGGGKIFPDQLVVVTQPTAGTFKAFSAVCTHQGCTVGQVSGGLIICPCHGSEYSIADGSVKRPAEPGQRPLPTKQVTVANGEITVV
jgi:Rieske Fe-S protein